ncbi:putative -like protein [Gossypium arboreum]|uniref:Putative-like protein n=1 Tax=Gossypium arboreum TaxID=29729 RepID=A0A0B0MRG2_GOSAR|nr:putative -like protein [Gossypium arboreum]
MGSCVSVHKSSQEPASVMKVGLSFGSKTDNNLIIPPSPVKEKPVANGDFAFITQSPYTFKDFDFTPSRGNTPVHHSFSVGTTPRVSKVTVEGSPMSVLETSPMGKKKKLLELFRESVREDRNLTSKSANGTPYHASGATSLCSSERTANGDHDNPMFKDKPLKSMQCCLPSFVTCSSFNERKKKMSPAIAVNDRP